MSEIRCVHMSGCRASLPQLQAVAMEAAARGRRVLQVGLRRLEPEPEVGVQLRRRRHQLQRRARRRRLSAVVGGVRERRRRWQHRQRRRHLPQLHLAGQCGLLVLVDLMKSQQAYDNVDHACMYRDRPRTVKLEEHKNILSITVPCGTGRCSGLPRFVPVSSH